MNLAALLPLALLLSGSAMGTSTSVHYRYGTWKKSELKVCFGDASHLNLTDFPRSLAVDQAPLIHRVTADKIGHFPQVLRVLLRRTIEKEYSASRTGIWFSGWKNCTAKAEGADIVLFLSNPDFKTSWTSGQSSIGMNLDVDAVNRKNDVTRAETKGFVYLGHPDARHPDMYGFEYVSRPEESFAMTALHEFGHIAGLGHEQSRIYQGQDDPNCRFTSTAYDWYRELKTPDSLGENVLVTGPYDPNSIMNYCYMEMIDSVTGTSYTLDRTLSDFMPGPSIEYSCRLTDEKTTVADRPKKNAAGNLPPNAIQLADDSLFKKKRLTDKTDRYDIRIGLSRGDIHALRCLYRFSEENSEHPCLTHEL